MVSKSELSSHIPIHSVHDHLHSNRQEQKQRHRSRQRDEESGDAQSGKAHHDEVATIPEKMNLGKYQNTIIFYTTTGPSDQNDLIIHMQVSSLC